MNSRIFCPAGQVLTTVVMEPIDGSREENLAWSRFLLENSDRCNMHGSDLWCCMGSRTVYDVYTEYRRPIDEHLQEFTTFDAARAFAEEWACEHDRVATVVMSVELEEWTGEMATIRENVLYATDMASISVERDY